MSFFQLRTILFGTSAVLTLFYAEATEAQIVRRGVGGGIQVNAPFVNVNVGPGGTSVRAPFTAINTPGRVSVPPGRAYLGRRRRFRAQAQVAAPQPATSQRRPAPARVATPRQIPTRAKQPTILDVDRLPYPTTSQLAAMDDATLIETLRQTMARFNYRLSLLKTGEGWQDYLVLSREQLGAPGAPPEAAQLQAIQTVLPRYASVQNDAQFVKIATLPSFVAAYNCLQKAKRRLDGVMLDSEVQPEGPWITNPSSTAPTSTGPNNNGPTNTGPASRNQEILPTPEPASLPNATRGERSILKRK